jgi:hypothetical protein
MTIWYIQYKQNGEFYAHETIDGHDSRPIIFAKKFTQEAAIAKYNEIKAEYDVRIVTGEGYVMPGYGYRDEKPIEFEFLQYRGVIPKRCSDGTFVFEFPHPWNQIYLPVRGGDCRECLDKIFNDITYARFTASLPPDPEEQAQ